jgi:hypothetical protein
MKAKQIVGRTGFKKQGSQTRALQDQGVKSTRTGATTYMATFIIILRV